uniref:Histone H2A n=1 Tax=Panagrolaimus superbus TaxID=310955 RepID=A0A914Y2H8_9BILA
MAGHRGKSGKLGKESGKNRALSRSAKAGLTFPVGRMHRYLKRHAQAHGRVAGKAAVYLAAVIEYLVAEVIELAGNASKDLKVKRITPPAALRPPPVPAQKSTAKTNVTTKE